MSGSLGPIMGGGGVDSSIPLQAGRGAAQTNPLASTGQLVNTLAGINQLKLFPGQMQLQQQQIQGGAASLAAHLNQVGANAMLPALTDPNLTIAKLTHWAAGAEAVANGTTQGVLAQVGAIPFAPDTPQWSQAVRQIIASQAQTSPEGAVAQIAGTPVNLTAGNRIISGVQGSAVSGAGLNPASSTPIALSPGEAAQRVPGPPGPHGEPTTVPLGAPQVTPNSISQLNMGSGRLRDTLPAALQNPNAPVPVTPIPGQMTTGVGPAAQEAMGTAGRQAAQGFQAITDQGVQARGQDAVLANMQNDLAQFTSGTNADKTLGFKRFIQSWSPTAGGLFGIDPKSIAAQESFDKLANQLADAQGAGSDARLRVNQGANPDDYLSPTGADFIIRQLRGNADYTKARQQLAAQYPDKTDLPGFEAKQAANLNPQVFQYNRLTPQQKSDYYNALDPREKPAFQKAYQFAQTQGLLGLPNAGQ